MITAILIASAFKEFKESFPNFCASGSRSNIAWLHTFSEISLIFRF